MIVLGVDDRVERLVPTALDLPGDSRVIAITRDGESRIVAEEDDIREGDKVLLITHKRHLHDLKKRFSDTPSD